MRLGTARALLSGIGLTIGAIGAYYLRMIGRYRIQIGLGGIGVGAGISLAISFFLVEAGSITPMLPFILDYIMLFISIVLIIVGILNFNLSAKMKK